MVSPNILIGPRLKVQRAYGHIEELAAKTNPLMNEWYSLGIEADTTIPYAKPSGFTLRYRPTQPIAELFALIIGDAVHNLRCALDHLATGIRSGTTWKVPEGHFPMRKDREELISPSGTPIPDLEAIELALPGSVHLLLDEIRPANGGDERLWSFHALDNDDKHNLILPTVAVTSFNMLDVKIGINTYRDCSVGGNAARPINIMRSKQPFAIEGDTETIVEVKFGAGTPFENDPVIPTLTQIAGVVSGAIDKFECLIENTP